MKKLILLAGLITFIVNKSPAPVLSTNINATGSFVHLLSTNRASIYKVEFSSTANGSWYIYDNEQLTNPVYGTNFVNAAYIGVSSYPTNYVTSFTGNSGAISYYTNSGIYTYTNTVSAATNALNPAGAFAHSANYVYVFDTDILCTRGVVLYVPYTNVNAVLYYH